MYIGANILVANGFYLQRVNRTNANNVYTNGSAADQRRPEGDLKWIVATHRICASRA